ncbi:Uncharacterised protein [Bordetella pertussis]|nr:Uncharacterised protein [Bordetella pertussis]
MSALPESRAVMPLSVPCDVFIETSSPASLK